MSTTHPTPTKPATTSVEHFEVVAVRGGQVSTYARGGEIGRLATAQKQAEKYQAEADEYYQMEARGPVKPIRVEYIVVRVIVTREVV